MRCQPVCPGQAALDRKARVGVWKRERGGVGRVWGKLGGVPGALGAVCRVLHRALNKQWQGGLRGRQVHKNLS